MELRRGEPRRSKSLPNRGELPALQHAALEPEPAQRGGEWWNRRRVDPVALLEEAQQLRDRSKLSRDPHRIVHRAPGADPVGAKRTSGKAGHQLQRAPELQDGQGGGRSLNGNGVPALQCADTPLASATASGDVIPADGPSIEAQSLRPLRYRYAT